METRNSGKSFSKLYCGDLKRYSNNPGRFLKSFHYFFRKAQTCRNSFLKRYYKYRFKRIRTKINIELSPDTFVGEGLYLGHPFSITINPKAVIGRNCNIHKGVTIGQENRGIRKGAPIIGNEVWIGINSTIVGKVIIGDDVLIAPNSFVNCDVPSHSVVFGNPCIIKHKNKATEDYINNKA